MSLAALNTLSPIPLSDDEDGSDISEEELGSIEPNTTHSTHPVDIDDVGFGDDEQVEVGSDAYDWMINHSSGDGKLSSMSKTHHIPIASIY